MNLRSIPFLAMLTLVSNLAVAGVYSDALGKCLVTSSTDEDKTDLVRWMFATITLHPAVSDLSSITAPQREEIYRTAGRMFERLLTVACRKETEEAVKYEGQLAIQQGFQTLGQVASVSMMTDSAVRNGLSQLGNYIDKKKLVELGVSN